MGALVVVSRNYLRKFLDAARDLEIDKCMIT